MKNFLFKTLLWTLAIPLMIAPLAAYGIGLGISTLGGLFHKRKKTPQERFYADLERKYKSAEQGVFPTEFEGQLQEGFETARGQLQRNLAGWNIEGGLRAGAEAQLSGQDIGIRQGARERYKEGLLSALGRNIPEAQPDYFEQIIGNVGATLENLAYLDQIKGYQPGVPSAPPTSDPYGVNDLMAEYQKRRRQSRNIYGGEPGASPDIFSFY